MNSLPRVAPAAQCSSDVTRTGHLIAVLLIPLVVSACSPGFSPTPSDRAAVTAGRTGASIPSAQLQSRVMNMADDYIAAISEAVMLYLRRDEVTPQGRALAQSFLRNGVGAALDIGAGPNPAVNLLDLLVLSTMQTRAFEDRWMPAGIGEAGTGTLVRMRQAETDLWSKASDLLTAEQAAVLRRLIDAWFEQNPHRTVVSLVRFVEFSDSRNISSTSLRGQATGLLREISEVTGAIDDARLFGERALWFTSRYPFVVGQQTELTLYRLAAQPEAARLFGALEAVRDLAQSINDRIDKLGPDLGKEQDSFFDRVAAERARTISQAETALSHSLTAALNDVEQRFRAQRADTVEQFFDRLAAERRGLMEDITGRQNELRETMTELQKTAEVTSQLAREVTTTIAAADKVAGRFARDPSVVGEPLSMADVREVALAAADTAAMTTRALEEFNKLVNSPELDRRMGALAGPLSAAIDRAFYRGVLLVVLLVAGLAVLKLIPQRRSPTA